MKRRNSVALLPLMLAAALAPLAGTGCSEKRVVVVEAASEGEGGQVIATDVEGTEGAFRITLPDVIAPEPLSSAVQLVNTDYGSGPGQLGAAGDPNAQSGEDPQDPNAGVDPDADPSSEAGGPIGDPGALVGPQSVAATLDGEVVVLDNLNERIVRLGPDGTDLGSIPLTTAVASGDIGVDASGRIYVLATAPELELTVYLNGALVERAPIANPGGSWPMGLVVLPGGGAWMELSNGTVVPVGAMAQAISASDLPGVPVGDNLYAYPALIDDDLAAVRFFDPDGILVQELLFESTVTIAEVTRVAVDRDGRLYAILTRFRADEAGTPLESEHLVLAVSPNGQLLGKVSIPTTGERAMFRPVAVSASGEIVQLHLGTDRARVLRWELEAAETNADPPADPNGGESSTEEGQ